MCIRDRYSFAIVSSPFLCSNYALFKHVAVHTDEVNCEYFNKIKPKVNKIKSPPFAPLHPVKDEKL